MRSYNAAGLPLIGVAAVALLILNPVQPALATTETAAPAADVKTLNEAPSSAAATPATTSAGSTDVAKPATEEAAAKPKPLPPTLVARIHLTSQTMVVQAGGKTIHTWKVSTGAPGYATPPGTFRPGWMAKMWRSRQYDDAPMPYSVFFNGGIAVHGTMNPGSLGRAASHGCVRLATSNAATFYRLVSHHGMAQTRIIVHGAQPFSRNIASAGRSGGRGNRAANTWVYANSSSPYVGASRASSRRLDSYGYAPRQQVRRQAAPKPRRMTVVRAQSTYWSR
jgi:lipoprotein-anchoring transpeptidase ErfK/SrfK